MATRDEYRIGEWRFDVGGALLSGPQGQRRLEHRAARTLEMLCRRRGDTVTHREILQEVWDGRAISPNSLAVVIADLRRSLDDDARDPHHIATVAKRGYRLNAAAESALPVVAGRWPVPALLAASSVVLLLAAAAIAIFLPRVAPPPAIVLVGKVQNATGLAAYTPLSRALDELVVNRVAHETTASIADQNGTAQAPGGRRAVRLAARLILWNGQPTLSLTATDSATGSVLWSAMAAGPADHLATTTIVALHDFGGHVRTL